MAELHGFMGSTGAWDDSRRHRRPTVAAEQCPNCGEAMRTAAAVRGMLRRRRRCPLCDAERPAHVVRRA